MYRPSAEEIDQDPELAGVRYLRMLPGWAPRKNDQVWVFSRYARRRRDRGQSIKVRRYPADNGIIGGNNVMDSLYETLPAYVKCSVCGFVNLLTPNRLEVEVILRPPSGPHRIGGEAR